MGWDQLNGYEGAKMMRKNRMRCHRNSLFYLISCAAWPHNLRAVLGFFAIIILLLVFVISNEGTAQSGNSKLKQLIEFYGKRAFAYNTRARLIKFDVNEPLSFSIECFPYLNEPCKKSYLAVTNALLVSANAKFVQSENARLRLVLTDNANMKQKSQQLAHLFKDGFSDFSDSECQIFYNVIDSKISESVILVSVDQAELKQKVCLTVQIGQALGLSTPANQGFGSLWTNQPSGYQDLDAGSYAELQQNYSILEYIQMCPELRAGMTLHEVIDNLVTDKTCTRDLRGMKQ
jgi:hypothetical protein